MNFNSVQTNMCETWKKSYQCVKRDYTWGNHIFVRRILSHHVM